MEFGQHLLGRAEAGIDDAVERVQMAGFVAAIRVEPGAAAETAMGERDAFPGDLEQSAVLDPGFSAAITGNISLMIKSI